jgi:hypothetical protein
MLENRVLEMIFRPQRVAVRKNSVMRRFVID